jgi:hypothetical protein
MKMSGKTYFGSFNKGKIAPHTHYTGWMNPLGIKPVIHSGLQGFWTLSIIWYSKKTQKNTSPKTL